MGDKQFLNKLKLVLVEIFELNYHNSIIAELVKISNSIVSAHLKYSKPNIIFLCQSHGISLSDLAVDSIAEIFGKDNAGELHNLKNFFSTLSLPIKVIDEKELFLAYKGLLIRIAEAQIARLYAEIDPTGYKIQRNIKETLPSTGLFTLIKNINGVSLICNVDDNRLELPYLNLEEFTSEFLAFAKNKKTSRELIEIMFRLVSKQDDYRKEIKLIDAVYIFKKYFSLGNENNGNEEFIIENLKARSTVEDFEMDQICDKVLIKIKEKILIDYFARWKLTREQSEALYLAMNDIIYDWNKMGENHIPFYEYFNKYGKLSHEEYSRVIKDKIEYLVKIARKKFELYLYSNE
jgi:hypothetical protein